jgi:hypothetical protein
MKNPWMFLLIWVLPVAGFPQTGGKFPVWRQVEYQRDVDTYERQRDAEYQEERALDITGVPGGFAGLAFFGGMYEKMELLDNFWLLRSRFGSDSAARLSPKLGCRG